MRLTVMLVTFDIRVEAKFFPALLECLEIFSPYLLQRRESRESEAQNRRVPIDAFECQLLRLRDLDPRGARDLRFSREPSNCASKLATGKR